MWRQIRYVLVLVSLCAIATCPSAHRSCRATLRAREAPALLAVLEAEIRRLVESGRALPASAMPATPALHRCCDQGGQCAVEPELWASEPWKTLRFSMDRPHRYSIAYTPSAWGATISLIGDVDCDGRLSSYQLRATVTGQTVEFVRSESHPRE
jgi:hypothetical protein